jgi:hypothetical protein
MQQKMDMRVGTWNVIEVVRWDNGGSQPADKLLYPHAEDMGS